MGATMAPYEYRVKCTPCEQGQQAWTVEVWAKRTYADDGEQAWRLINQVRVEGRDWPHDPRRVYNLILRATKV